jgi:hypothetical protein
MITMSVVCGFGVACERPDAINEWMNDKTTTASTVSFFLQFFTEFLRALELDSYEWVRIKLYIVCFVVVF